MLKHIAKMNNFNELSNFFGKKYQRSTSFFGTFHIMFTVAAIVSAADSCYVLFFPMKIQFMNTFQSASIASTIAIFLIGCYVLLVDYSLAKFLPTVLKGIFANDPKTKSRNATDERNLWLLHIGTLVFCLLQTAATIFVTLTLRHSASEITTEKPVLVDVQQMTKDAQLSQSTKLKAFDDDIKRISNERDNAVSNVRKSSVKMTAYTPSGKDYAARMKELKNNEASADREYNAKKRSVAGSFDDRLKKAEAAKSSISNDPTLLTALNASIRVNDFNINSYNVKTQNFADFLQMMSLASTAIMWFCGLMLGFYAAVFNTGKFAQLVPNIQGDAVYTGNIQANRNATNSDKNGQNAVYTENTADFLKNQPKYKDVIRGSENYKEGYIFVTHNGLWYDPTRFTNWLRNAYNRSKGTEQSREILGKLQYDLYNHYFFSETIDKTTRKFVEKHPLTCGFFDNNVRLHKVAIHEAGHFISAIMVTGNTSKITIVPNDVSEGHCIIGATNKEKETILLGGLAAEKLEFNLIGDVDFLEGGKGDIRLYQDCLGKDLGINFILLEVDKVKKMLEPYRFLIQFVANELLNRKTIEGKELELLTQILEKQIDVVGEDATA
jgi:hypothetical protein